MPKGNDCPACGENIGIGAVFKAPVPNRIYCPHCGERLRYDETGPLTVAAVLLMAGLVVVGLFAGYAVGFAGVAGMGVALGVFLLGAVALEVAFVTVLWYGGYRLEQVNPPKMDWDDEEF